MKRKNNLFSDLGLGSNGFTEHLLDTIFENQLPIRKSMSESKTFIQREDSKIKIHINAVGLGKDDIKIKEKDGNLIIMSSIDKDELSPLVRNIGHRFTVPEGYDGKSAVVHLKNGILTITLSELEEKEEDETVIEIQ